MEPISAIAPQPGTRRRCRRWDGELVKAVVKDGYEKLKALVKSRYPSVSVELIEQAPDSKPRRDVVEQDLSKAGSANDAELVLCHPSIVG